MTAIFCYGSNMSSRRLRTEDRCPHAEFNCVAFARGYLFKFNKKSTLGGGSGKGNIIYTGNSEDVVWGVVFDVTSAEEAILDVAEGLGNGYNKIDITVHANNFEKIVKTYISNEERFLDDEELPFDWYMDHCVRGAKEFNLPNEYVEFLNSFQFKTDTNLKRRMEQVKIYDNEIKLGSRYCFDKDGERHTGVAKSKTRDCVWITDDKDGTSDWIDCRKLNKIERGENIGKETGIL